MFAVGEFCADCQASTWSSPRGSFVFALGEGCADHFVCKWGGGLRPHQPPALKGQLKNKHQLVAMWIVYVCSRRRLCGSFCLQIGGAAPPLTPRFLEAIDACNKEQASSRRHHRCWRLALQTSIWSSPCGPFMFALGEGCAHHFACKWVGAAPPPNPLAFKGHRCLH